MFINIFLFLFISLFTFRTPTKEPTKKLKNIESVTKTEKEKTDRSQQVITSPTVGVTLLKSGNAAKDKRFFISN